MAPPRATSTSSIHRQHESKLRKLATDDTAREKARDRFASLTAEAEHMDVLQRCKRLNEFLSEDYAGMDKAQRRDNLAQVLEMLAAPRSRPSILDKPSALAPSKAAPGQAKSVTKPKGRSLAESAAAAPKVTSTLDDAEAFQLLDILDVVDCDTSQAPASSSSRPASCAASSHDSARSAKSVISDDGGPADDDLISLLNPSSSAQQPSTTDHAAESARTTDSGEPSASSRASAAREAGASKVRELQKRLLAGETDEDGKPLTLKLSAPCPSSCTPPMQLSSRQSTPQDSTARDVSASGASSSDQGADTDGSVRDRVAEEARQRAARIAAAADTAAAEAMARYAAEQAAKETQRLEEAAREQARIQAEQKAARARARQEAEARALAEKRAREEQQRQEAEERARKVAQERADAALCIQTCWRARTARQCVHALLEQAAAATCIQRAVRAHQARLQLATLRRLRQLRVQQAARLIQRAWRKWKATRGWQLGELRVPVARPSNTATNTIPRPTAPKRASDGDILAARPVRVRSNIDARLAPEQQGQGSVPNAGNTSESAQARHMRRAMSATRQRSCAIEAQEEAQRRQLGERVVMTSSVYRTHAQALAIATQRAVQPRQRALERGRQTQSGPLQ